MWKKRKTVPPSPMSKCPPIKAETEPAGEVRTAYAAMIIFSTVHANINVTLCLKLCLEMTVKKTKGL